MFSVLLVIGVALHLILSWKWIMHTSQKLLGSQWRRNLLVLCCSWIVTLTIAYVFARF
jgi:hypothetical protein